MKYKSRPYTNDTYVIYEIVDNCDSEARYPKYPIDFREVKVCKSRNEVDYYLKALANMGNKKGVLGYKMTRNDYEDEIYDENGNPFGSDNLKAGALVEFIREGVSQVGMISPKVTYYDIKFNRHLVNIIYEDADGRIVTKGIRQNWILPLRFKVGDKEVYPLKECYFQLEKEMKAAEIRYVAAASIMDDLLKKMYMEDGPLYVMVADLNFNIGECTFKLTYSDCPKADAKTEIYFEAEQVIADPISIENVIRRVLCLPVVEEDTAYEFEEFRDYDVELDVVNVVLKGKRKN